MGSIQANIGYKVSRKFEILPADISQRSLIFNNSANKQCTAMCAVAIAFSLLCDPFEWNKAILTQIILRGNLFYNVSQHNLCFIVI